MTKDDLNSHHDELEKQNSQPDTPSHNDEREDVVKEKTLTTLKKLLAGIPQNELMAVLESLDDEDEEPAELERISGQQQHKANAQIIHRRQSFSGPLPPPHILADYEQITTGAADRIISMAEREQTHRHTIESTAISGELQKRTRGQIFAFALAVLILLISTALILAGHNIVGFITLIGAISSLCYIFISGQKTGKTSESDKDKTDAAE